MIKENTKMNKSPVMKVLEIVISVAASISFIFLIATHISHNDIWLVPCCIFGMIQSLLLCIYYVMLSKKNKKKRYLIAGAGSIAVLVGFICGFVKLL